MAARGPARRYGAGGGTAAAGGGCRVRAGRVLDPVAAELLRYREVREQYVTVTEFSTTGR